MGATSDPDTTLFKKFRAAWKNLDKNKFITGENEVPIDERANVLQFLAKWRDNEHLKRDDYRELLELVVIFLGGNVEKEISFRKPGAISHARWMAKALYAYKIYMLQNQFELSTKEKIDIKRICVFIACVYVRAWFTSTCVIAAPFADFNLMQQLIKYQNIDEEIGKAVSKKFSYSLWYLVPETVALSFFDENVPNNIKSKMAKNIWAVDKNDDEPEEKYNTKKFILHQRDFNNFKNIEFANLTTPATEKISKNLILIFGERCIDRV